MSGGSYNYLCWNTDQLSSRRSDLEDMTVRLERLPYAGQAAAASRRVLTLLDEAQRLAASLTDVWHAIEWWDSSDWSEKSARPEVEAYVAPDGQRVEDVFYRLVPVDSERYELRPVVLGQIGQPS